MSLPTAWISPCNTSARELATKRKTAAVAMVYAAIEGLSADDACNTILAALQDDGRFGEKHLTDLSNLLGRAAHMIGRADNSTEGN